MNDKLSLWRLNLQEARRAWLSLFFPEREMTTESTKTIVERQTESDSQCDRELQWTYQQNCYFRSLSALILSILVFSKLLFVTS